MFLSCLVYQDRLINNYVVAIINVVFIIVAVVGYTKFRGQEMCMRLIFGALALGYAVTLLTAPTFPYLFAFALPICLCVIIYNNLKVCTIGTIACVGINIIYTIEWVLIKGLEDTYTFFQITTNDVMCIILAIVAILVVKKQQCQSAEAMSAIEQKAKEQTATAGIIQDTSSEIAHKLDIADEILHTLTENVVASAESMSQVSESTKLTAMAIQTQTEMSSNITESLHEIATQTQEMMTEADNASNVVADGNQIVNSLKNQSVKVGQINQQVAQMTHELQEKAEAVNAIISAILSISSQTNLLSLNASIEAARAGEAGKGFAVVAGEIRDLSDSTKASAEEISNVIAELSDTVTKAMESMGRTVEETNKQEQLIDSTEDRFTAIKQAVTFLTERTKQIADEVDSSVAANNEVMDSISNLSATSEEVAASSETSLELSEECVTKTKETTQILDEILALAQQMNR